MAFYAAFTLFLGSRAGWIDCNLVVSRDGLWESSFIFSKGIGLEEMKREKRQTLEAIGLDSREVLLLLILMQKLMIIQVNAVEPGWLQKKDVLVSNETAMIWNSYYNTHVVVPNKRQLPNFSLIFRIVLNDNMPSKFLSILLWYFFLFDKLSFDPLMYFVIISSESKII